MIQRAELFYNERQLLYQHFSDKLEIANHLNRKVVSFQANKAESIYRWFRYKEGFSSNLVKYFLKEYSVKPGKVLDPFAGAGTTLFAGQEIGWEAHGIELLPVGTFVMQVRDAVNDINYEALKIEVDNIWNNIENIELSSHYIKHIPITKDAFPQETEDLLNKFLSYCKSIQNNNIRLLIEFAAFSILEDISYTRKDGQYLRWDHRSNRNLTGKTFDKGKILNFEDAVKQKLQQIVTDLSPVKSISLFDDFQINSNQNPVNILQGSCLEELPKLEDGFFDFTLTSPPYCNRYDYTRTYALELVYLGYDNEEVRNLRQAMLSCTVENKEKLDYLYQFYNSIGKINDFDRVIEIYNKSKAMLEVNSVLDKLNSFEKLNNSNIPRMVKNYFLEMCFVIFEISRVTKSGGYCVMVNDNVRYGGEEIPVDLILSEFAENFGFNIKKILVLPKGKGNSSQQMGNYGRTEIRKCVYLWQKR